MRIIQVNTSREPTASLHLFGLILLTFLAAPCTHSAYAQTQPLDQKLRSEPALDLAADAGELGDAANGALLFHSPGLGCAKCHATAEAKQLIGPDLAEWKRTVTDAHLIESILTPSSHMEPDYRSRMIVTSDGQSVTGVAVDRNESSVVLRTGVSENDLVEIALDDIEAEKMSDISLMPSGQVNALRRRQDFLDLVAYLIEIRDGGRDLAKQLQPSEEALRLQIPEYESELDHRGFIADWNRKSLRRGEAIYQRVCQNCHGTVDQPGSLPTSLRFAEGKFKFGSDPYTMYQTLTHGGGMMVPQSWMVPQQKYDVIHYIREHFLRSHNETQYANVDDKYLASLPSGSSRGPEPTEIKPWVTMDYGPMLITTIQFGDDPSDQSAGNIAQKAIAIRVDDGPGGLTQGNAWVVFEHDTLRMAAAWTGEFVDWNGIQFNERHGVHLHATGDILASTSTGPGWANPANGSLDDTERVTGRDGRRYGPLPSSWGKYRGLYRYEDQVILEYSVGQTRIRERPSSFRSGESKLGFARTLNLGSRTESLDMVVMNLEDQASVEHVESEGSADSLVVTSGDRKVTVMTLGFGSDASLIHRDDAVIIRFKRGDESLRGAVAIAPGSHTSKSRNSIKRHVTRKSFDLEPLIHGGPTQYPLAVESPVDRWFESDAWGVDELTRPEGNPWLARTRVTGLDFTPGGDGMVVCTWDGDVWSVEGLQSIGQPGAKLKWRRVATGLFQPLGILWEPDRLMVTCRDQLVALRDQNGDGEMDQYQCFNSDHQVTEHFHEFAMGLQRDADGNYYYAKSARHALTAVVPHHGTLLRVPSDGGQTDILAVGFRAANGVCLNDDGSFIVTDQEGHWNPKNRINWVQPGGFYGNMYGYHDVTDEADAAMQQPLCWITNEFDRSPAELLWARTDRWGPLNNQLLNLSYGYGRVYVVPHEMVTVPNEASGHLQPQGGMCQLPIPDLPTGMIRGRFSNADGQLYIGGMFSWAGSRQEQEGGLFRVQYRGGPVDLPTAIKAWEDGIDVTFSDPLDADALADLSRFRITTWDLKRTKNYGSKHLNERPLDVTSATLAEDRRTVRLRIPELRPTWGMEIIFRLRTSDGREIRRVIHNTIHYQDSHLASKPAPQSN